jgi:hypothetical protein
VNGQLFQTLMLKVSASRSTSVLLIGVAVAVKASSEVRNQLLVYILAVVTVVVLPECNCRVTSVGQSPNNTLVPIK